MPRRGRRVNAASAGQQNALRVVSPLNAGSTAIAIRCGATMPSNWARCKDNACAIDPVGVRESAIAQMTLDAGSTHRTCPVVLVKQESMRPSDPREIASIDTGLHAARVAITPRQMAWCGAARRSCRLDEKLVLFTFSILDNRTGMVERSTTQ